MEADSVLREGGRRVAVYQWGAGPDEDTRTVVFCHPAPGAGSFDPDPEQTRSRRVRMIGLDRPGYGRSDPVGAGGWATVGAAADDAAAVLDGLGTRPVGVAGWSAGGRVALALATRRPDLVDRVVVFATPAPDDEVPWIPAEYRAALEALRGLPPERVHAALGQQLAAQVPADPYAAEALDTLGRSAADAAVLAAAGARQRLGDMMAAAYAQGAAGVAADIAGYCLQPWGFEPAEVKARTLLLYGGQDPVAGHRHARWWQTHLPRARIEMSPDAGHLLVIPRWQRALSHLAPHYR
jgi:pimeloyl-ACP methyl ester carboxylesterase